MQINDFRLVFSPDVQSWVSYKLNASNPGQFYYNVIAYGGADVIIDIPYPFETQGAQPVHVYSGDVAGAGGCFLPNELDALWAGNPVLTCEYLEDPVPEEGLPDVQPIGGCTFTIPSNLVPGNDLYYINVHLDYGFKGVHSNSYPVDELADRYDRGGYISPWSSSDALVDTPGDDGVEGLAIADCQEYVFSHSTDGELLLDSIQNVNLFKQIAGAFGRVYCDDTGEGFSGYSLELYEKGGDIVRSTATDEDGYYALTHKHRGKPSEYTVQVHDPGGALLYTTDPFFLQGNGWVELNTYQVVCGDRTSWEDATVYGSGKFKDK